MVRLPLGRELYYQRRLIHAEGLQVFFHPQVPLLPQPGQGGQHRVDDSLVGLGVQGGGEVPYLILFGQTDFVLTPYQGQVADVGFLEVEDLLGLFLFGGLVFIV
jgi:hypothetical protein